MSAETPRCLWVSGSVPHPPVSGLMVYSANLSEALARTGADVVGIGLARPDDLDATRECSARWTPISGVRPMPLSGLLRSLPYTAYSHGTRAARAQASRLLSSGSLDVVVVDHLQSGWVLSEMAKQSARGPASVCVYLSHNYETSVRAQVARRERLIDPRRVVLTLDAVKIARLERRLVERADIVTAITEADALTFREVGARTVHTIVPGWSGTAVDSRLISKNVPRRVAVLGHWEWHVKQANLERFLAVADPLFAAAGADILILGPAPKSWVDRLGPQLKATHFSGWVDDLGAELASCRIGIVSEPAGGGFKLKSLDYVFNRLPMAVLEGSVAGLPLDFAKDLIVCRDEAALAAAALDALDDFERLNRMQEAAFATCDPLRGWAHQGGQLRAAIDEMLQSR